MGHIYWSSCLNATSLSPLATAKALGLDIPPTMLALTSDGADGDGVAGDPVMSPFDPQPTFGASAEFRKALPICSMRCPKYASTM
jgi:hypothetical protein